MMHSIILLTSNVIVLKVLPCKRAFIGSMRGYQHVVMCIDLYTDEHYIYTVFNMWSTELTSLCIQCVHLQQYCIVEQIFLMGVKGT